MKIFGLSKQLPTEQLSSVIFGTDNGIPTSSVVAGKEQENSS